MKICLLLLAASCIAAICRHLAEPGKPRVNVGAEFEFKIFADDDLVSHPVAICVDPDNRIYLAETNCLVYPPDYNFDEQLASQTRDSGRALREKTTAATQPERLLAIMDDDQDGVADRSVVVSESFGQHAGCASGIAIRDGEIWLGCAPHLWRLRDRNQDQVADEQTVVQTGFGVRTMQFGHDLNSITFGPDGRAYFCMGDRGLQIETREGKSISVPNSGSILRCWPDGSEFEVFATGLRNPRGLAFDHRGNLWTSDNDANKGDRSRLIHVIEGADYGWRVGYQPLPGCGPWTSEKLYEADSDVPWRVPAVGFLGKAPSGLEVYPGTGLPRNYDGQLFVADYVLGVHNVRIVPDGAGYRIGDSELFMDTPGATDVAFGTRGEVFVSDWVWAYAMKGQGRLIRIVANDKDARANAAAAGEILAAGMTGRETSDLIALLAHDDYRVRLASQQEITQRGTAHELDQLRPVAAGGALHQRLHAIWAISQLGRKLPEAVDCLREHACDENDEVRHQVAKALGEFTRPDNRTKLLEMASDQQPRVRSQALISLGKQGVLAREVEIDRLVEAIGSNANNDAVIRHASSFALSRAVREDDIAKLVDHTSDTVRLAAVLALRRLQSDRVADFLDDHVDSISTAAARAIHDVPIKPAIPQLAAKLNAAYSNIARLSPLVVRRSINANFQLGSSTAAQRLVTYAIDARQPAELRNEAIRTLGAWPAVAKTDRITGAWNPLPRRSARPATMAVEAKLDELLRDQIVAESAAAVVEQLSINQPREQLIARVRDPQGSDALRISALRQLRRRNDPEFPQLIQECIASNSERVVVEALALFPDTDAFSERAFALAHSNITSVRIRQAAIDTLARWETERSRAFIAQLIASDLPDELQLEIHEAAARQGLSTQNVSLEDPEATKSRLLLSGGDAGKGEVIFYQNQKAQCARCHIDVQRDGIGPSLIGIGKRQPTNELLRSILDPGASIADGYRNVTIALTDGSLIAGRVIRESSEGISLKRADGTAMNIPTDQIDCVTNPVSAMPTGLGKLLSKRDLRDLIAYLRKK